MAVSFFAKALMFDRMAPGSIVTLPTNVVLVELMGQIWVGAEEGLKELFQVLIVRKEDRVGREWSK